MNAALAIIESLPPVPTDAQIVEIGEKLLHFPQVPCKLTHSFQPGVYLREIEMPAGTFVIGHKHDTEHFNVILTGRAIVLIDGEARVVEAPCYFKSHAGCRKVLFIEQTMHWMTIHPNPTDTTDIAALESGIKAEPDAIDFDNMKRLKTHVAEQTITAGGYKK